MRSHGIVRKTESEQELHLENTSSTERERHSFPDVSCPALRPGCDWVRLNIGPTRLLPCSQSLTLRSNVGWNPFSAACEISCES